MKHFLTLLFVSFLCTSVSAQFYESRGVGFSQALPTFIPYKDYGLVWVFDLGGMYYYNADDEAWQPANSFQTIRKAGSTVTLSDAGGSFTDDNDIYDDTDVVADIATNSTGISENVTAISALPTDTDVSNAQTAAENYADANDDSGTDDQTLQEVTDEEATTTNTIGVNALNVNTSAWQLKRDGTGQFADGRGEFTWGAKRSVIRGTAGNALELGAGGVSTILRIDSNGLVMIGRLTAINDAKLSISDKLAVAGDGDFNGSVTALEFIGDGSALTDVNAFKLDGQEADYYTQTLDVSTLVGTDLYLSLSSDGEATKTIDLSSLQDGTGTDDQTLQEVTDEEATTTNTIGVNALNVNTSAWQLKRDGTGQFADGRGEFTWGAKRVVIKGATGNALELGAGGVSTILRIDTNGLVMIGRLTAINDAKLSISGKLAVAGDGDFNGSVTAIEFEGDGSALEDVNAFQLEGQEADYYTQTFDVSTLVDTKLNLSLSNDGQSTKEIDLNPIITRGISGSSGSSNASTGGAGVYTVTHNLGADPTAISCTARGATFYHVQVTTSGINSFKVKIFNADGSQETTATNIILDSILTFQ